jgi:hypothetical protein
LPAAFRGVHSLLLEGCAAPAASGVCIACFCRGASGRSPPADPGLCRPCGLQGCAYLLFQGYDIHAAFRGVPSLLLQWCAIPAAFRVAVPSLLLPVDRYYFRGHDKSGALQEGSAISTYLLHRDWILLVCELRITVVVKRLTPPPPVLLDSEESNRRETAQQL